MCSSTFEHKRPGSRATSTWHPSGGLGPSDDLLHGLSSTHTSRSTRPSLEQRPHAHDMCMHISCACACACMLCMCVHVHVCPCACVCAHRPHTGHTGLHSASSPRRPCCEHTRRVCHSSTDFLSAVALRVQPLPRTHRLRKASKRAVGHIPPNQYGRLAQVLCKHHVCSE